MGARHLVTWRSARLWLVHTLSGTGRSAPSSRAPRAGSAAPSPRAPAAATPWSTAGRRQSSRWSTYFLSLLVSENRQSYNVWCLNPLTGQIWIGSYRIASSYRLSFSHTLWKIYFVAGAADSRPLLHDEAVEARLQLLLYRQEGLPEWRGLAILCQRRGVRSPQHVHAQQCRARYYLVWRK